MGINHMSGGAVAMTPWELRLRAGAHQGETSLATESASYNKGRINSPVKTTVDIIDNVMRCG